MTTAKPSVKFKDPINGEVRTVRSVCRPAQTLLQGKEYKSAPSVLTKGVRYYVFK